MVFCDWFLFRMVKIRKEKYRLLLLPKALSYDSSANYMPLQEKNYSCPYFGIMAYIGNCIISSVLKWPNFRTMKIRFESYKFSDSSLTLYFVVNLQKIFSFFFLKKSVEKLHSTCFLMIVQFFLLSFGIYLYSASFMNL